MNARAPGAPPSSPTVIGNVNVDLLVHPAAELPPPGTEWAVEAVDMRVGGAAGNAALTLAALARAPRLVGCVGQDRFGGFIRDELATAGVALDDLRIDPNLPTGVSIAFEAPGRDRSFLTLRGSLGAFDRSMVPDDALHAPAVLCAGYFLLPSLRGAPTRDLLAAVRARGGTTFLDLGWDPDGFPASTRDEVRALLPLADVFLPNAMEATALAGRETPIDAARELQRLSGGVVVVKLGARGAHAATPEGELTVQAPEVDVVDTTGAGDACNAGLVAGLTDGLGWPEALAFAVRVASTVVARGSSDRHPTRDELLG